MEEGEGAEGIETWKNKLEVTNLTSVEILHSKHFPYVDREFKENKNFLKLKISKLKSLIFKF